MGQFECVWCGVDICQTSSDSAGTNGISAKSSESISAPTCLKLWQEMRERDDTPYVELVYSYSNLSHTPTLHKYRKLNR